MSIKYDVYKTPSSNEDDENESYHARLIYRDTVDLDFLATQIQFATSMTEGDVRSSITSLCYFIAKHLSEGDRVQLEGLGGFQLSATAPVVEDPAKMRGDHLRVKTVKFFPDPKLMSRFKSVKFERAQGRIHSATLSDEEILALLGEYLEEHYYISRFNFEILCGFTKSYALKKIKQFIQLGKLKSGGGRRATVYEKGDKW